MEFVNYDMVEFEDIDFLSVESKISYSVADLKYFDHPNNKYIRHDEILYAIHKYHTVNNIPRHISELITNILRITYRYNDVHTMNELKFHEQHYKVDYEIVAVNAAIRCNDELFTYCIMRAPKIDMIMRYACVVGDLDFINILINKYNVIKKDTLHFTCRYLTENNKLDLLEHIIYANARCGVAIDLNIVLRSAIISQNDIICSFIFDVLNIVTNADENDEVDAFIIMAAEIAIFDLMYKGDIIGLKWLIDSQLLDGYELIDHIPYNCAMAAISSNDSDMFAQTLKSFDINSILRTCNILQMLNAASFKDDAFIDIIKDAISRLQDRDSFVKYITDLMNFAILANNSKMTAYMLKYGYHDTVAAIELAVQAKALETFNILIVQAHAEKIPKSKFANLLNKLEMK